VAALRVETETPRTEASHEAEAAPPRAGRAADSTGRTVQLNAQAAAAKPAEAAAIPEVVDSLRALLDVVEKLRVPKAVAGFGRVVKGDDPMAGRGSPRCRRRVVKVRRSNRFMTPS